MVREKYHEMEIYNRHGDEQMASALDPEYEAKLEGRLTRFLAFVDRCADTAKVADRITHVKLDMYQVRGKGKHYQTKHYAYRAAAKDMVLSKYPNHNNPDNDEYYSRHEDRLERRLDLFVTTTSDHYGEQGEDWDGDAFAAMVDRLAKFLRFVDERIEQCQ
jgi:hypothetical protein